MRHEFDARYRLTPVVALSADPCDYITGGPGEQCHGTHGRCKGSGRANRHLHAIRCEDNSAVARWPDTSRCQLRMPVWRTVQCVGSRVFAAGSRWRHRAAGVFAAGHVCGLRQVGQSRPAALRARPVSACAPDSVLNPRSVSNSCGSAPRVMFKPGGAPPVQGQYQ